MPRLHAQLVQHQLRDTFKIARFSKDHQDSLIVSLVHEGVTGYGECTSNAYYKFAVQDGLHALKQHTDFIESIEILHPMEYWIELEKRMGRWPFLLCALDEAYWDLYGQLQGASTRALLDLGDTGPQTSLTLSIGDFEETMHRMDARPWPIYKLKSSPTQAPEILHRIVDQSPSPICIDANASWSTERTKESVKQFDAEKVIFIEQPLAVGQEDSLLQYGRRSPIDLIADESAKTYQDLAHCAMHYGGVNVKLMKCGGITPAYRMMSLAKTIGLRVMIGCMAESSIGISAAAQLISLADYVDLDGAMLISNDPAEGISWSQSGNIIWNDAPGNGLKHVSL